MPTRNVDLTDHFDSFIDSGVMSGRFSDASEVIGEALRLLEQREAEDRSKIEWLRGTAQDAFAALDRGEGVVLPSPHDIDAFVDGVLDEVRAASASGRD